MIFLVSTPQRCGSTWLVRTLCAMAGSRSAYVDGLKMGYSLANRTDASACEMLVRRLRRERAVRVFKTHDVPSREFDALCTAMPEVRVLTLHRDFRDTVVSRYFYIRYYWPTDPSLGQPGKAAQVFLSSVAELPDGQALIALLDSDLLRGWAREWAAFEGPFSTSNAVRLTYVGMRDGSEFPRLAEFTGLPLRKTAPFAAEQERETKQTGREEKERFNRKGRIGEWRDWWNEDQGRRLLTLAQE